MCDVKEPLVSIVVPCYNHEAYVCETIQSLIEQDYKNIELIIIDDGSRDDSVRKIKEMIPACRARFKRFEFRNRDNKGLCATLNEAIKWCAGDYLACIASDDIALSFKTRMQVEYLEKNQTCIGVFGGVCIIDKNNKKDKVVLKKHNKYNFNDIFFHKHTLPAATQMLRIKAVRDIGGFREGIPIEDWSMWLFLTHKGGHLDYLPQTFACYRRHDNNFSEKYELMHLGRMQILGFFKEHKKYNQAVSFAWLVQAHCIQTKSKIDSLDCIVNAIKRYPFCLFSKSFASYLVKMLVK